VQAGKNVGLETVVVRWREAAQEIQATAVIKPNEYRLAHVSPRIPGRAMKVLAFLGDQVKEGQTLALLDSLELGERRAAFLQAKANLAVARRNLERERRLFDKGISSQKEYLEAKGTFERDDAAYRAALEALRLLGLSDPMIDRLAWGPRGEPLSYFPMTAPVEGIVIDQHITTGELIGPEDRPYTIADLTTVWVVLDIFEKDIGRVRLGARARVSVDAYPSEVFQGKVTYISSELDPETRTARARVEIANQEGRLRPGMFATARLTVVEEGGRQALQVPRGAIQSVRGHPVAFVDRADGTYAVRKLVLGDQFGDNVEVVSGLTHGERVVTRGAFYLKSILLEEDIGEHGH